MTKHIKKYVKLGLLLFGISICIYTCQQEDDSKLETSTKTVEKSTTKMVSVKDIPEVIHFIQSKSNRNMEFVIDDSNSLLGQNRNHEENLVLTSVMTDQIKQVTNNHGKSNYTFKMSREEDREGVHFINLIVKEYRDTYYIYITKYVPETNWLENYKHVGNFYSYTGAMYFYSDEGIYLAKMDMVNGSSTTFERHPCDNGGGGGGGGDPDGSGGGNGGGPDNNNGDPDGDTGDTGGGDGGTGDGGSGGCTWHWEDPDGDTWDEYPGDGDNVVDVFLVIECSQDKSAAISFNNMLRHSCEELQENCHDQVGDPCPCNDEGTACADDEDENDEVGVLVNLNDPCAKLNALETNDEFKMVMQNLKDAAATDNHETGYFLTNNSDGYDYSDPLVGEENNLGISTTLEQDEQIASFVHNHNDDSENRDLSVYSAEDLYAVYIWLKNDHIQASGSFFSFLVTNHGTAYALNISDAQAFITFGDLVFIGWGDDDDENNTSALLDEYFGSLNSTQTYPLGIKNENTTEENEKSLMKILAYPGLDVGLQLFKADANFENWQKLEINNNEISFEDICN